MGIAHAVLLKESKTLGQQVWIWGLSGSKPFSSIISAKIYGRHCALCKVGYSWAVWLSPHRKQIKLPVQEEWNCCTSAFPFYRVVQNDSVVERVDGCSFHQKVGQECFCLGNYALCTTEVAKEGQQLPFGAPVCQEIIRLKQGDALYLLGGQRCLQGDWVESAARELYGCAGP